MVPDVVVCLPSQPHQYRKSSAHTQTNKLPMLFPFPCRCSPALAAAPPPLPLLPRTCRCSPALAAVPLPLSSAPQPFTKARAEALEAEVEGRVQELVEQRLALQVSGVRSILLLFAAALGRVVTHSTVSRLDIETERTKRSIRKSGGFGVMRALSDGRRVKSFLSQHRCRIRRSLLSRGRATPTLLRVEEPWRVLDDVRRTDVVRSVRVVLLRRKHYLTLAPTRPIVSSTSQPSLPLPPDRKNKDSTNGGRPPSAPNSARGGRHLR